jgi:hypothetical protein
MQPAATQQFSIALNPNNASGRMGDIGVVVRRGLPPPIIVRVKNTGITPLVLTVANSTNNFSKGHSDDETPDAYVDISVNMNGVSVASVTVVPSGEAIFFVTDIAKDYLLFKAAEAGLRAGAVGVLEVSAQTPKIDSRERIAVP